MSLITKSIIYQNKLVSFWDLKKDLMDVSEFIDCGNKELEKPIYHMDLPAVTYLGQNNDFQRLRGKIQKFSESMLRCERTLYAINEAFNKLKQEFPNILENVPEGTSDEAAITHFESDVARLVAENQENRQKVQNALVQIDDWLALKNYRSNTWLTGEERFIRDVF